MSDPVSDGASTISLEGVRAVMLDLDDTLVTYSPQVNTIWPELFAEHCGQDVERARLQQAWQSVQKPIWRDPERQRQARTDMRRTWAHIMTEALRSLEIALPPQQVAAMAETFAGRLVATVVCLPGSREFLAAARRRGLRIALVSNGDARIQRAKLAHTGLAECFDVLALEGELGTGKPDPRVYAHALEKLGCRAEQAVMIGDNIEFDVAAAQAVGIRGVWFTRHGRTLPPESPFRPDAIVQDLAALLPS